MPLAEFRRALQREFLSHLRLLTPGRHTGDTLIGFMARSFWSSSRLSPSFLRSWAGVALRFTIERLPALSLGAGSLLTVLALIGRLPIAWAALAFFLAILSSEKEPPTLVRRFLRHIGLVSVFGFGPVLAVALHQGGSWWLGPTMLASLALLPLLKGWWIAKDKDPRLRLADPTEQLKPRFAHFRANEISLLLSAKLLMNPSRYVERIVHEVHQDEGYLTNVLQRQLTVPSLTPEVMTLFGVTAESQVTFYVPLLQWPNDRLVDDLDTRSTVGPVPLLLAREARLLTASLFANMTHQLYSSFGAEAPLLLPRIWKEVVRSLLTTEAGSRVKQESSDDESDDYGNESQLKSYTPAIFNSTMEPPNSLPEPRRAEWEDLRDRLGGLLEALLDSRVIYGEVNARLGEKLTVSISYASPLEKSIRNVPKIERVPRLRSRLRDRAPDRIGFNRDHLRLMFGMRSPRLRILLSLARAAESYHLRFAVPRDQFIYDVKTIVVPGNRAGTTAQPEQYRVAYASPRTRALRYVHVYARPLRIKGEALSGLVADLDIRERPPGVLGVVALVALIQAMLIATVFGFHDHFFAQGETTDLAPLLLALPGLISAWLANQVSPERLQRTSLAAVLGIGFNGAIALSSTVLALLAKAQYDWQGFTLVDIRVAHPIWLLLGSWAAWNAGNLIMRWWNNTWVYTNRFRAPERLIEMVEPAMTARNQ